MVRETPTPHGMSPKPSLFPSSVTVTFAIRKGHSRRGEKEADADAEAEAEEEWKWKWEERRGEGRM